MGLSAPNGTTLPGSFREIDMTRHDANTIDINAPSPEGSPDVIKGEDVDRRRVRMKEKEKKVWREFMEFKKNKSGKNSNGNEFGASAPQFAHAIVEVLREARVNNDNNDNKIIGVLGDAYGMHLGTTSLSGVRYFSSVRDAIAGHPCRAQLVQDLKMIGWKPEASGISGGSSNAVMDIYLMDIIVIWFNYYIKFLKKELKIFWLLKEERRKKYLKKRNGNYEKMVYNNYYEFMKDLVKLNGVFMEGCMGTGARIVSTWCQDCCENASPFGDAPLSNYWLVRGAALLPALAQRRGVLRSMDPGLNWNEMKLWAIPRANRAGLARRLGISLDSLESQLSDKEKKKFGGAPYARPFNQRGRNYNRNYNNRNYNRNDMSSERAPTKFNGWCNYSRSSCPHLKRGHCRYKHSGDK